MPAPIFFHLGLERTGTTFLQKQVFPRLENIRFVKKQDYRRFDEIYQPDQPVNYLVSHELGRQFEPEVNRFAKKYPHATPVLFIRKQADWIASQYRRDVKNGLAIPFEKYFNLGGTSTSYAPETLLIMPKIELLKSRFTSPPLIYDHQDLLDHPEECLERLTHDLGARPRTTIDFSKRHTSYRDKELHGLLLLGRYVDLSHRQYTSRWQKVLRNLFIKGIRYPAMLIFSALPGPDRPLIPSGALKQITEYYAQDWRTSQQFVKPVNEV